MACLVSRTGRELQRYNHMGFAKLSSITCQKCWIIAVVIPYRFKYNEDGMKIDNEYEVLVISSQKGQGLMFPKGGWELDESLEQAASRESLEDAGVLGQVEMSVGEAREVCRHWWMKEALDILVERLTSMGEQKEDDLLATDDL
ncbi:Nudix hydrolase 17, mitochondrial, partial [Cucurbita argyrosperma subsp. sororia]